MSLKTFGGAIIALAAIVLGATRAEAVFIDSDNQGWVNDSGDSNGGFDGNNTFTGNEAGNRFNSWANFDLTGVGGPVTSANLTIVLSRYPFLAPEAYTLGMYDVSTSLASLLSDSSGVAGYTDLGSGNSYGSISGTDATITVALNAAAIADINAALGGTFRIGFTNLTLNSEDPNGVDIGSYINGFFGDPRSSPQLELTQGSASVPEPTSLAVFGVALLIAPALARRKRLA